MAYSKEYYESHKEQMKKYRDKYRKNSENREKLLQYQKEYFKNLSQEQKDERNKNQRERRAKNSDRAKLQYRISLKKRQIKQYTEKYKELDHRMFMLNMVDSWTNEDREYNNELSMKMKELKAKIDTKEKEITELKKEMENFKFIQ